MANKNVKIEKETRRLIEGISDLVKKKGDTYKFKSKNKKKLKQIKKSCVHWTIRKGKPQPTLIQDPNVPGNWKCTLCGASFPIVPVSDEEYEKVCDLMLSYVNQIQFLSVTLGGDADDTKMFLNLKKSIPRFEKVAKQVIKHTNKRNKFEKNASVFFLCGNSKCISSHLLFSKK